MNLTTLISRTNFYRWRHQRWHHLEWDVSMYCSLLCALLPACFFLTINIAKKCNIASLGGHSHATQWKKYTDRLNWEINTRRTRHYLTTQTYRIEASISLLRWRRKTHGDSSSFRRFVPIVSVLSGTSSHSYIFFVSSSACTFWSKTFSFGSCCVLFYQMYMFPRQQARRSCGANGAMATGPQNSGGPKSYS